MRRGAIALALMAAAVAGCGGKKDKQEAGGLKGTGTGGGLGPAPGALQARGADLADGARMAAEEINAKGGVLGHKVELQLVDDACEPYIAYEGAKSFMTAGADVIGVIGGVCDEAAAREIPTLDSTG